MSSPSIFPPEPAGLEPVKGEHAHVFLSRPGDPDPEAAIRSILTTGMEGLGAASASLWMAEPGAAEMRCRARVSHGSGAAVAPERPPPAPGPGVKEEADSPPAPAGDLPPVPAPPTVLLESPVGEGASPVALLRFERPASRPFEFADRLLAGLLAQRLASVLGLLPASQEAFSPRLAECEMSLSQVEAVEAAIRASEESYRTIFDLASDAIFVHDPETGAIVDANRQACALHGRTLEQLKEEGLDAIGREVGPFTKQKALERIRLAAAGESLRFEWLVNAETNKPTWAEVSLNRVVIGGVERVLANVRDIHERKTTEQALREAERHSQDLAERMRAVAGAAAGVIGADSIDALLPVLRDAVQPVIPFDSLFLSLYDEAAHTFTYSGFDLGVQIVSAVVSAAGTPSERVIGEGRSVIIRRSSDPESEGAVILGTQRRSESIVRTPILSGKRALGVLSVQSYTEDLYCEEDVEVLEAIASLAASALLNLELLGERHAAQQALLLANQQLENRVQLRTAELQQRTEELEAVFRALPDVYIRVSAEGVILDYRVDREERLYLPPEQFLGRKLVEVLPAEAAARVQQALAELQRTGELVCVEYMIPFADCDCEYEARMLPLEDGSVISVVRNISDRKAAERAMQRREEHFRRLIENAHDLVQVIDTSGTTLYVSPSVERIIGYAPEELIGRAGTPHIHPDDRAAGEAKLAAAAASPGTTVPGEFRILHRDGSWRVLEAFARTLSPDSVDEGIVVNARDITERKQFDEALRDSEARYRSLIENAHDIVTLLDLEGHITYQSPQVRSVLGYEPAEMIGRNVFDFVHPDDLDVPRAAWEKIREAPSTTFTSEHRFRHRNGSWRYLEAFGRLLVPNAPEQGLVLNTRDVTERREAEAMLQEREEHFRQLIETSHDLVQTLDQQGRIVYTGPSVERLLGYTPEEITGSGTPEFIHPDDQPRVKEEIIRALSNPGRIIQVEYRVLHKNGGWRWFEAIGRTLSPDTAEMGMVANARDITERREAEQALQEREEHFRRLIENSGDMVQLLDSTGRIMYTGPSVLRLLGYTPEDIEGTDALGYIHPGDREKTAAALESMLVSPEEVLTAEYRVRHREGQYRLFEAFASSLLTPDGGRCVVVNARDVTERRLAEVALATAKQEAEQAREAAERANRAKSEFLSRMSHELRTPMNSILGFAQLLDRAPLAQEQKKGVGYIMKAGRHLLQLINEVLEIARIEAGRNTFSLEPVRLATALQEAVALVRPLAAQWRVELEEGAWPGDDVFVQADRQRLTQVLLNVLANAIKYNRPGGRVQVSCDRIPGEGYEKRIAIRVKDTGRGIAEERRDQLFTPFSRLGAEQSEVEGTGLGLALSQRLTEAMDGALTLESTGPEGSVFRIELPTAADPLHRLEAPADAQPQDAETPHAPARLLYIEDNLANLNLVETILLCRPRWHTMPALQGLVGLDLAREHRPDLIMLDLHLPDITGEEVLRRLRADQRTASIPVVVITADATRSTVDRLRNAGADAYLTKPLDIDEFLETIERFLPRATQESRDG
jgi:PAS domain S-box-containing protein